MSKRHEYRGVALVALEETGCGLQARLGRPADRREVRLSRGLTPVTRCRPVLVGCRPLGGEMGGAVVGLEVGVVLAVEVQLLLVVV